MLHKVPVIIANNIEKLNLVTLSGHLVVQVRIFEHKLYKTFSNLSKYK